MNLVLEQQLGAREGKELLKPSPGIIELTNDFIYGPPSFGGYYLLLNKLNFP